MHDATGSATQPRGRWVGLDQAARILNVSRETARRRAVAGQLEARREERPQGAVWRVFLQVGPAVERPPARRGAPHEEARQEPAAPVLSTSEEAERSVVSTPAPANLVPVIAALVAQLDGLRADLGEARRTAEQLAAQLVEAGEERGRLGAQLEHAQVAQVAADAALVVERRRAWLLGLALAVLVTLMLVLAGVAAAGWAR